MVSPSIADKRRAFRELHESGLLAQSWMISSPTRIDGE
jgi:hypothetical protein